MSLLTVSTISAVEFERLPDTAGFELLDGILVEKKMGARSSLISGELHTLLNCHCKPGKLGLVFPSDTAYKCFPGRPNHIRKPDVSFIRHGRFPHSIVPEGYIAIAPDFAAEVIFPNDTYYEVEEKVEEFLSVGVRLVWVIAPPTRSVRIFRGSGNRTEVGFTGVLEGEDVVPGFRCRVADLFVDVLDKNGAI